MTEEINTPPRDLQSFDVGVCRTGYGFATIKVDAVNEYEAQQLALDQAGNHLFNEKDSHYDLSNPVPSPESVAKNDRQIQLVLEMAAKGEVDEPVAGASINLSFADFERWKAMTELVKKHDLSEVRQFFTPDAWLYRTGSSERDGLDVVELTCGKSWFTIEGVVKGADEIMASNAIDLAVLEQAFASSATELCVTARYPHSSPLDFYDAIGRDTMDLGVDVRTIVVSPAGQMTADEYQDYLSEWEDGDTVGAPRES